MLTAQTLAIRPEFRVDSVTCRGEHARWSEVESGQGHRLVLVRRGRFRRRVDGLPADLDASVGYLGLPRDEEHFAHPHGGDVCTCVNVSPRLWHAMAGEEARLTGRSVYLDARTDLTHRRLLASARCGDVDYAVTEELLGLLKQAVSQTVESVAPPDSGRSPRRPAHRDHALVAAARAVILDDDPAAAALLTLADLLEVSPYRLSRAFTRELGVSLTRYRNRVRVGRALDRIEQGERNLSLLAADLGYADQAHLCRTVRAHVGHTPTALRTLLAAAPGSNLVDVRTQAFSA